MTYAPDPLAIGILQAAVARDYDTAAAGCARLYQQAGHIGMHRAGMDWIRAALHACGAEQGRDAEPGLEIVSEDNRILDPDDLDPWDLHALRLMNAARLRDKDTYAALIQAIPAGRQQEYQMALLHQCAALIRKHQP